MNVNMLKSKRISKGLIQRRMANKLQITPKTYNSRENGRSEFRTDEILNITAILNLSLEEVNEIFFDNRLPKGK